MPRCSSSHGYSSTPCSSCGYLQAPTTSNSPFSMLFSMSPNQHHGIDACAHAHAHAYPFSSSSSVDCTLSLGTPSTRQSNYSFIDHHHHIRETSSSPNVSKNKISWDIFQSNKPTSSTTSTSSHKPNKGVTTKTISANTDPLLARRCANCDTTSTPLWRNGPRGPKSLCNACGIRYKKEERRAASTTSATMGTTSTSLLMDYMGHHHMNTWSHHQGNEFRFIEDNDGESSSGADTSMGPFFSWRLSVPVVHDYS